jgi:two-component system, OmpR family, sensor histidine kinase ChvG
MASPTSNAEPLKGTSLGSRIILINALAMVLMVAGLLYFGRYLDQLLQNEVDLLLRQANLTANKIADEAVGKNNTLDNKTANTLLAQLSRGTRVTSLLITLKGETIARAADLAAAPPPQPLQSTFIKGLTAAVDWLAMLSPYSMALPMYDDRALLNPAQLGDVVSALKGNSRATLWADQRRLFVATVAVPVIHEGKVAGAVLLTRNSDEIAATLRSLRIQLLQIFGLMLGISMILSLYMAQTIALPLRRLARAAKGAQTITGGLPDIPDYQYRGDEIAELSVALRSMTMALFERLGAIEMFAADVAHELKNPLTSMRSALETLNKVQDPAQRERLLAIINEDVARMQRLITDIAAASRLEAEISRTETEQFDFAALMTNLITSWSAQGKPLSFHVSSSGLYVQGIPSQLVQVAENLISNALSFSPPGQPVSIRITVEDKKVVLRVEDNGPGIPKGKQEKIFERFYSERPDGEAFGTHSGLGLSICRQIVEAHGGKIYAENRQSSDGTVIGARFVVILPLRNA